MGAIANAIANAMANVMANAIAKRWQNQNQKCQWSPTCPQVPFLPGSEFLPGSVSTGRPESDARESVRAHARKDDA